MLRRIMGTAAGIIVAMVTIGLVEWLGQQLFPPPPGVDMADPAAIARAVASLPTGLKASVSVAWFVGTFVGGLAGLAIARWRAVPWIVAATVVLAAVANYVMIPHPLWMQVAGIALPPLAAILALRLRR